MGWVILYYLLEGLKWLIIARAVMSWFANPFSRNPIIEAVRRITDPILRPISQVVPVVGGLDLSPLVAFFAIALIQMVIAGIS